MRIEDYDSFKEELKRITARVFTDATELYGKENVMGFALVADKDGRMLSATVNTWRHLQQADKDDSGNALYYKFTPAEWTEEFYMLNQMDDLNQFLDKRSSSLDGDKIISVTVDALEELKQEGLFEGMDENFVLLFAINDLFVPDLLLNWFERLNGAALTQEYNEFLARQEGL